MNEWATSVFKFTYHNNLKSDFKNIAALINPWITSKTMKEGYEPCVLVTSGYNSALLAWSRRTPKPFTTH